MKRDYNKCNICNTWHWSNEKCPDTFYFKHEDWGEDWEEIRAHSFIDAAETFAKLYNGNGDYVLMNDNVDVLISDGKVEKLFNVSAEPDIYYSVTEIEEVKCEIFGK